MLSKEAKNERALVRAYLVLERVLRDRRRTVSGAVVRVATRLGRFRDGKEHLDILLKAAPEGDADLFHLTAALRPVCAVPQGRDVVSPGTREDAAG
jgi:hypothetical protein